MLNHGHYKDFTMGQGHHRVKSAEVAEFKTGKEYYVPVVYDWDWDETDNKRYDPMWDNGPMADLNAEQFLVESPTAAAEYAENALITMNVKIPKLDHKDKYIQYLFDEWND